MSCKADFAHYALQRYSKKLQLPKLLVPHLDKICLRELGVAGQAPIEIEITGTRGAQRWGYAPSGRTELYP